MPAKMVSQTSMVEGKLMSWSSSSETYDRNVRSIRLNLEQGFKSTIDIYVEPIYILRGTVISAHQRNSTKPAEIRRVFGNRAKLVS